MEPKLLKAERFVDMQTGISYRYVYSETEYFRPHFHDYCEIFLVMSGGARHLVGDREFYLQPRQLVFVRPQDTHDYISDGGGYSMLNITFTMETLRGLFAYLGDGFPVAALMNAPVPPQVLLSEADFAAINSRMTAVRAIDSEDVPSLKTALRVLLFELFSRYFSDFAHEATAVPPWLERACTQLRQTGGFVEGAERLFALADRSREHVCRSMKKYMGITVSEYINGLRLQYVASMLRSSNHSISQIVFESGFNNLSWATQLFRKRYGMSMLAYRKNTP